MYAQRVQEASASASDSWLPVETGIASNDQESYAGQTPQLKQSAGTELRRRAQRADGIVNNRSSLDESLIRTTELLENPKLNPKCLTLVWQRTNPDCVSIRLNDIAETNHPNKNKVAGSKFATLQISPSTFSRNSVTGQSQIASYLRDRANIHIDTVEFLASGEGKFRLINRVGEFLWGRGGGLENFQTLLKFLICELKEKPVKNFKIHMDREDSLWEQLSIAYIQDLNKRSTTITMTQPAQSRDLLDSSSSESHPIHEPFSFEELANLHSNILKTRFKSLKSTPVGGCR